VAGKARNRSYSEDDRAAALAALLANGGNLKRTARDTGVPESTLRKWSRSVPPAGGAQECAQKSAVSAEAVGRAGVSLAEKLDGLAHKLADAMPDKIPDATLSQTAVSLGVAIDKARLLRGEATSINDTRQRLSLEDFRKLPRDEQLRVYREALATP
jgi:transposase-like protein